MTNHNVSEIKMDTGIWWLDTLHRVWPLNGELTMYAVVALVTVVLIANWSSLR